MIKEKRKKRAILKKILIAIVTLTVLLVLTAVIVIKVFRIEEIVIEGNELYGEELIKETVFNDEYSCNSLYVYLKYKFTKTKELPFIDTMEITLKNPHTLHINVYEKGLLAYVYIPAIGENAYFDKDGIVVETATRKIEDIPQIYGVSCDQVVVYEKLPIDSKILKNILTLTQTLKRNSLIPDGIFYEGTSEFELSFGQVKVKMGSLMFLTEKVERLHKILPSLESMAGTLHLENWTEESTNIVFEKIE